MNSRVSSWVSGRTQKADIDRYRKYHEAKARIPLDLPPKEFEERVKELARKYRI